METKPKGRLDLETLSAEVAAVVATFIVDPRAAFIMVGVYVAFIAYFALYSRHHIVAQAPEEEFAAIQQAESELAGS